MSSQIKSEVMSSHVGVRRLYTSNSSYRTYVYLSVVRTRAGRSQAPSQGPRKQLRAGYLLELTGPGSLPCGEPVMSTCRRRIPIGAGRRRSTVRVSCHD